MRIQLHISHPLHKATLIFLLLFVSALIPIPPIFAQETPSSASITGHTVNRQTLQIEALIRKVQEEGRTVDHLTEGELADLPVGIARKVGETTYIIAIDSAYSDERGWFLSAYASFTLPGSTTPVAFAARNIAFNKGGLNATTQARLLLASPQRIALQ
jgi:hypothetical protein